MFRDGGDFQTVWRLAHNWVNADPDTSDVNALSPELVQAIHRLMIAMRARHIAARTKSGAIFWDDSFFSNIFDLRHYFKFLRCLKTSKFDKVYLDSLYVRRGNVLSWCVREYIAPPALWAPKHPSAEQSTDPALQADKTIDSESSATSNTEASQQKEAAYARHQPILNLKQECIRYWLQHQKLSNDKAADKFFQELPPEKKRLLTKDNGAATLSQAISEYRNREKLLKERRLPRWLVNFNPESPPP